MEVIIWNDDPSKAEDIVRELAANDIASKSAVFTSYMAFSENINCNLSEQTERDIFFQDHLVVSDLCIAKESGVVARAEPFRRLIENLYPGWYPIILFSLEAHNNQALGGAQFHDWLNSRSRIVCSADPAVLPKRITKIWEQWLRHQQS